MAAKTSPGRFLRRRSSHVAGTRNWLLGVGVFVLVGAQASAAKAFYAQLMAQATHTDGDRPPLKAAKRFLEAEKR
jgi:hypothetical protein